MNDNQDYLNLLRKIKKNSKLNQRQLANELGFSLGKLNYCLKALKNKGLIKIENFTSYIINLFCCKIFILSNLPKNGSSFFL